MSEAVKKKNTMYYINSIITLVIIFGFGQLPAVAPLTPLGMNLIGIFLGLLYGWIFVDIVWPSCIGILALMLVGGMAPKVALNTSFGDPTVLMMFFIFIFCAAIDQYGLSKFISMWFITRKFVQGRPWAFTFVFLASIFILGALTSASPAAIIGWSILYSVCELVGYKKGDPYPTMMVFSIVFAAQVGMCIIPFKQVPLTVLGAWANISGTSIDYAKYMLIAIIIVIVCAIYLLTVNRFVFKPDVAKLSKLDATKLVSEDELKLNKMQKIVLLFLAILILALLLPSFLPKDFFLARFLNAIGGTGVCILVVTIMCLLKVDGKPIMSIKKMIDSGVAWPIVFLLAAVQPLSSAMTAEESGITEWMMGILDPIFSGHSTLFFVVVIGAIAGLVTNVMNNGALGVALLPIIYSYCMSNNLDPQLPVIIVVLCVHFAFLTPAASSSAALLHGNDWIQTKDIMRTVPIVIVGSWLLVTVITVVLGNILL